MLPVASAVVWPFTVNCVPVESITTSRSANAPAAMLPSRVAFADSVTVPAETFVVRKFLSYPCEAYCVVLFTPGCAPTTTSPPPRTTEPEVSPSVDSEVRFSVEDATASPASPPK